MLFFKHFTLYSFEGAITDLHANQVPKKLTNRDSGLRMVIEAVSSKYYKECKARSAERIFIREQFEAAA